MAHQRSESKLLMALFMFEAYMYACCLIIPMYIYFLYELLKNINSEYLIFY